MIDLDAVIADTHSMAPLPTTVTRLVGLFAGEWSPDEASDVLRSDAPLMARLQSMAHSGALGGRARVPDVERALIDIGPGAVLALSMRTALPPLPSARDRERTLWTHSIAATLTVEALQRHAGVSIPSSAHATALLHDIGKAVLGRHLSVEHEELLRRAHREGRLGVQAAEMELLEANHGEIGGLVARHWSLPDDVVDGISYHHAPEAAPTATARTIACAIALANGVIASLKLGDGDVVEPEVQRRAMEHLKLEDGAIPVVRHEVSKRLAEFAVLRG